LRDRKAAAELLDERLVAARVPSAIDEVAAAWTLDLLGLPAGCFFNPR
jgi:hypothetical protein